MTDRTRLDLTFGDVCLANERRCARWHPGGVDDWTLSDWAVALAGEVGEACNLVKKLNRARDGITGNRGLGDDDLRRMLGAELADCQHYLVLLALRARIDLAAETILKFNQVSREHGFTDRLAWRVVSRDLGIIAKGDDNG